MPDRNQLRWKLPVGKKSLRRLGINE
jgi:hypothetical protein